MSNDPKLELELRKLAEFRLVRFLVERTVRGLWADSPPFMRIVYQRSCQPQKFIADSPPKDRGQSAYAGQILPETVSVSWQCKKFKGGRSARLSRTVRDWTEWWGRPDLTYNGCPSHSPPPNRTQHQKVSLSFSLKHMGETTRSRLFGVISGWSENISRLFSRLCIMSSRYFDESLTLVLGFLYWKELGLDAPICFWTMDS